MSAELQRLRDVQSAASTQRFAHSVIDVLDLDEELTWVLGDAMPESVERFVVEFDPERVAAMLDVIEAVGAALDVAYQLEDQVDQEFGLSTDPPKKHDALDELRDRLARLVGGAS